jgi:hypothetical protein
MKSKNFSLAVKMDVNMSDIDATKINVGDEIEWKDISFQMSGTSAVLAVALENGKSVFLIQAERAQVSRQTIYDVFGEDTAAKYKNISLHYVRSNEIKKHIPKGPEFEPGDHVSWDCEPGPRQKVSGRQQGTGVIVGKFKPQTNSTALFPFNHPVKEGYLVECDYVPGLGRLDGRFWQSKYWNVSLPSTFPDAKLREREDLFYYFLTPDELTKIETKQEKQEKPMTEAKKEATVDLVARTKNNSKQMLYKVARTQITELAQEAMIDLIAPNGKKSDRAVLARLLATPDGAAFIQGFIGTAAPHIPFVAEKFQKNPHLMAIADDLQTEGGAYFISKAATNLRKNFLPKFSAITETLNSLDKEFEAPKARIVTTPEASEPMAEEEVSETKPAQVNAK